MRPRAERALALVYRAGNRALEFVSPTPEDVAQRPPFHPNCRHVVAPAGGWRDDPVIGPDACSPCNGTGVRERWIRKVAIGQAEPGYLPAGLRTCDFCGGTGRRCGPSA